MALRRRVDRVYKVEKVDRVDEVDRVEKVDKVDKVTVFSGCRFIVAAAVKQFDLIHAKQTKKYFTS